jgi:predicted nucleic acid-binding protein
VKLVVDASVAIKLVVDEADREAARRIIRDEKHELIEPDFLLVEAANILWKKSRLGEIQQEQVLSGLSDLRVTFDRFVRIDELVDTAVHMSLELDHPVYDCLYLALADGQGSMLVTADGRLLRTIAGSRYSALAIPLSEFASQ